MCKCRTVDVLPFKLGQKNCTKLKPKRGCSTVFWNRLQTCLVYPWLIWWRPLKSKCVFYNLFFVLTIAAEHCSETAHQHGFHFPAIFRNCGNGRTALRIRICYGSRNTSKSGFYFAYNNNAKRSSFCTNDFYYCQSWVHPVNKLACMLVAILC